MNLFTKCAKGMCRDSQEGFQESIQEKISLMYAQGQKQENKMGREHLQRNHSEGKKIFSFKLNGFRDYDESGKKTSLLTCNQAVKREEIIRPYAFDSRDRGVMKISQHFRQQQPQLRFFYSPPPLKLQSIRTSDIKATIQTISVRPITAPKPSQIPQTTITTLSNITQDIDLSHKQSGQTQYSSKKSENPSSDPAKKNSPQSLAYTFQDVLPHQKRAEQKCSSLDSLPSFISNNSFHTEKFNDSYPTFVRLDSIEPAKLFGDVKTIKTILTKSQINEKEIENSSKDFNEKDANFTGDKKIGKTEKKCMRKEKRKTAYFKAVESQSENERTLIDCLEEDSIHQQSVEHQSDFSYQSWQNTNARMVKFCLKSDQKDKKEQPPHMDFKKQNRPILKCNNNMIQTPSLHKIVESEKRHNISIGNSIKQLASNESQDNPFKFKYVNTIKSIGGQSIYSENSYIDIKFMQSLNSRKAIVRLL